ncbi:ATP-binding protein [Nocardioides immobilis]|uniref:ATP-binding protein n=1 Tax=Nocardioides immobilis TaxID=2049295 RepID=UPI0015FD4D1A|nr:NB-ARC domain-containing protein [Nocardioides immobilis]
MKSETHRALPAELTSFVGRRQQLAEIRRLLSSSRLLTLTGMGGAGKTRLALRTATETQRAFPDGAWFIELAALRDPQLLPHTIATALDLRHVSGNPLADLTDHLQEKQLLVVLDSCEHLTEACAVVVSKLLAEAPGLRVLATSRHVLDVEGEQVLAVPPLSIPEDAAVPIGEAPHYEAVTLLVERARAVDPQFQITEENRGAVIELCQRLDGLPLALELAAVWLRALSPAQILDRLEDRFQLLTTGRRTGPARHQALDAAVAWSFDLCSPEEQLLWTRLSIFSSGFDLEAAEEISAGDGVPREDVLELLAGLVGKSIVVRQHDMEHGDSWYRMLETIREYGARRLPSAQVDAIHLRHRDHYRSLANRFDREYFTSHQGEWYLRLRREHDNIRAAIEFCLCHPGEADAALDIAAPLWPWWHAGHLQEGLLYLVRALDLAPGPTRSRGYGLFAASNLAIRLSEFDRALALLAESGEIAEQLDDELLASRVKQCQGHALLHSGHPAEAVPLLEAALDDARRLGQPRDEWRDVNLLCLAMMFVGDPRAEDLGRKAVELAEDHGAEASKGWALWDLGLAQWRAGRYQDADRSLRDGIGMFLPMRNLDGVSVCVQGLSWCAASSARRARCPSARSCRGGLARHRWECLAGGLSRVRPARRRAAAVGDR